MIKILPPSPYISIRDRRALKDQLLPWAVAWPFTPLAWVESSCSTVITSQLRYYWVRKPLPAAPLLSPISGQRCCLEMRQWGLYICNWRESLTPEILLFCQESLKAVCASCGNQSCSSGAMRCIIWVLLAARLSSSITVHMMPLLPSHQAKFWARRLCEMHQKTLFPS